MMLAPADYDPDALGHPLTRSLMERIEFRHGGPDYDAKYPDGIPTTLEITHADEGTFSSGLVMYPHGHARNQSPDVPAILDHKFRLLAGLAVDDVDGLARRFTGLAAKSVDEIASIYDFQVRGLAD